MGTTKTGLVPQEDQGVIMVNIATSPGSTLEETNKVMNKLEDILKKTPEIEHYSRVAGYGFLSGQGTSYGLIVIASEAHTIHRWRIKKRTPFLYFPNTALNEAL